MTGLRDHAYPLASNLGTSSPPQLVGHEVCECRSLAGLCFQLKYQQPDLIVLESAAIGPVDQAIRILRGRHATVPVLLLSPDPNPGLNPIRFGYYAVVSHQVEAEQLMVLSAHAVAHHRMLKRIMQLEVESSGNGFAGLNGRSPYARRLYRKLQSFATADVHVLLLGEEGTGRTLAARAIHDHSARARGPFISLSCERLSESAFSADSLMMSGAVGAPHLRRNGALDDADRGTLFLSNIDRLSLKLQHELLQVLGEGSPCDFRLIASTSVNLSDMVAQGRFRPELQAHLSQSHLHLLPLRNRTVDIGYIGQAILDEVAKEQRKPPMNLADDAIMALAHHRFTRNVTELKEIISAAVAGCNGTHLRANALPAMLQLPTLVGLEALAGPQSEIPDSVSRRKHILFEILSQKPMKIRDLERCAIEATLQRTGDNVTQAMRELGIGRTTLYRKLKKYGRR
jgi:DNA-binding NtrC family response regulator